MSLNTEQRIATARELAANCDASGLSLADLVERTGLTEREVEAALSVSDVMDPAHVWLLRDIVEDACEEKGIPIVPFTVLTDDKRESARHWFGYTRPN